MVLRGCNTMSRHARECERNSSRPVFFSSKFWRGDFTRETFFFSWKLTPNGHRLSRCHTSQVFFFGWCQKRNSLRRTHSQISPKVSEKIMEGSKFITNHIPMLYLLLWSIVLMQWTKEVCWLTWSQNVAKIFNVR